MGKEEKMIKHCCELYMAYMPYGDEKLHLTIEEHKNPISFDLISMC